MAKRNFILSIEEICEIEQMLEQEPSPHAAERLQAVLQYGTGRPATEIVARLGCSRTTLLSWCQAYRQSRLSGLLDKRQGGNNAKLSDDQLNELLQRLRFTTPRQFFGASAATPGGREWTVEDIYRAVRQWYGVTYRSRSSYYGILSRIRM